MRFRVTLNDLEIRAAIVNYALERCADLGVTARAGATNTVEIRDEYDSSGDRKIVAHLDVELEV